MNRFILHVAAVISTTAPVLAQDKEKAVRTDRYGDPLPAGAIARLGTTRLRHTSSWRLVDAAFSPDGKMLASIGGDSRLRVWDTSNGKELHSTLLESFSLFSPAVAFSADGKTVAVSAYRDVALCDIGSMKPRRLPERPDSITGLAFAPDGKLLAVYGRAKTVSLIDPATGKEVRQLKGHEKAILSAAFSADGKTLATTSEDFTCRIWNLEDGKQKGQMETNKLRAVIVALSPNGKWIAWWDDEPRIHVRDMVTGKEQTSFKAGDGLFILDWQQSAMRFAPDGTLQALYWSRHLFQWHPEKGLKTREFKPVSGKTAFGRIAPDGKTAALWDWDGGTALHLFDLETGKEREVAVGHLKTVYTILAQPGGKLVASASSDGTIRLWDPSTSQQLRRWRPGSTFHPAVFTPDGKALVFSDYDGTTFVRIVQPETNMQLGHLDTKRTRHLAISGNGKTLLAADFTRIELWDFDKGKRLRELEGVPETGLPPLKFSSGGPWLTYTVHSLRVSPNGKFAAATFTRSGQEASLYLWDTSTGKRLPDWPGDKRFSDPIEFSPDGKVLAAAQSGKDSAADIVFWDLAKEKIVKRFPIAHIACRSVAFSKDGKLLALGGSYRGIVQIYDITTAKEIARFRAHEGPVSLTFSADSATLITGSEDTTLLVWDVHSKELRKGK
jgi:WD40 repeat protein